MFLDYFILSLGIILFFLILFQIITGKRIIKLNIKWHRIAGYVILFIALIHGIIAFLAAFGFISN